MNAGDFFWPNWIPMHRAANERELWQKLGIRAIKVVWTDATLPYLEDYASVPWVVARHQPLSENFGDESARVFRDEADAQAQARRDSAICEQMAVYAEHRGRSRQTIWFPGRNEPRIYSGGREPPHLVGAYELERLRENHRRGLNTLLFEWGKGWPDNWDERTGLTDTCVDWEPYLPAVNEMWPQDRISLHPYFNFGGVMEDFIWLAGRWLQRPFRGRKIWFGEAGCDPDGRCGYLCHPGFRSTEEKANWLIDQLLIWWQICAADPDVEGAFLFTFDGNARDWAGYELLTRVFLEPWCRRVVNVGLSRQPWGDARVDRWRWLVEPVASRYNLDPCVVATVIAIESGGNPQAYHTASQASGLMQVMPREAGGAFADRPYSLQLRNPVVGAEWGCRILAGNLARANGDLVRALAWYYGAQGPNTPQGAYYLSQFRKAWTELWSGKPCPLDGQVGETALRDILLQEAQAHQVIQLNPAAALQKAIARHGFVPTSGEFEVHHGGQVYVAQRAEHLGSGEVRVYYCVKGDWAQVAFVRR